MEFANPLLQSILLASLGVAFLSYSRDAFSDRAASGGTKHKYTDDASTSFWFISVFFAVIAAVLGRPGVTDKFARVVLDFSFLALLVGGFVFVWAEQTLPVASSFTAAIAVVFVGLFCIALRVPDKRI